uniref:Methyl-CpG-binding domain-containing protein n=1 Tax=Hucho hucho TaxID=62062 RepID=A0A4W5KII1_9TELE
MVPLPLSSDCSSTSLLLFNQAPLSVLSFQGKPDLNTALPIRQTASIFKQPVTKVVNHPNNKVKTDLQRATEQPRQVDLSTGRPLDNAATIEESIKNVIKSMGPDSSDETLLSAIASALHMSSSPITEPGGVGVFRGRQACADQLAGVFTDIFNQSLSQSA